MTQNRKRALSPSAQATQDGILELKLQGFTRAQIIQAGFPRSSVYRVWPVEPKQLTVPSSPDGTSLPTVQLSMSHEEFSRLGTHPAIVAGMMNAEREQRSSLRQRILRAVATEDSFADVLTLMHHMRKPDDNFDSHEVTHIIRSLNQQGCLKFVDSRQGSVVIPTKITITDKGVKEAGLGPMPRQLESPSVVRTGTQRHPPGWSRARHAAGKDLTEARHHRSVASGSEVMRTTPEERVPMSRPLDPSGGLERPEPRATPAPGPVAPDLGSYPLLTDLLARFEANAEADEKASRYAEAAAALENIDPQRSEELLALALEVGGKPFTPIEIEMLRLLEEVRRG